MANKYFINKLILGNNFEKLKEIESESVDLIYADPPFFSNEVIWDDESKHQIAVEAVDKQGLDGQDKVKIKIKIKNN